MISKIVLTMIVKDEEHVIERALTSCYKMIDSYCIVDTGSTDKTKEKIKNFFDSKGIDGKIIDFEFTNFEDCRNQSIEHAKDLGDYGFWMDADEELVLNDSFNKELFATQLSVDKFDQLLIECQYGGMKYQRAQFYRFENEFYWYGPVHEVLQTKNTNNTIGGFSHGNMKITPDGNSWNTNDLSKKYVDHANILYKYQEDNNWKDPRWTFYLAQSYKDAANIRLEKDVKDEKGLELCKKAIQYYTKRTTELNGFSQEIYYSQLMLARMSSHISTNEFVLNHLLKCEELNLNNRVEHIFNIGLLLQAGGLYKNALLYIKLGLTYLKKGNNANLFLESRIYDWALYDMYAISLYYTGKKEESLKYFKYALKKAENGETRDTDLERIRNNIKSIEDEISKHNSQTKRTIKV
jgi:hypothetical protein